MFIFFFFSSRRRHTRSKRDWSSDVCSSDLREAVEGVDAVLGQELPVGADLVLLPGANHLHTRFGMVGDQVDIFLRAGQIRSEERRVGKECRSGWAREE